jgi:hypothetical protein
MESLFAVTYTPTADGVYTLDLTILNRKFATHMFTVSDSMFHKNCGPEKTERLLQSIKFILADTKYHYYCIA